MKFKQALSHPYSNFPLEESLRKYSTFDAKEILDINDIRSWYEQGFNVTARQTITEHLEALKDDIDLAISDLNKILYSDILTGVQMAEQFATTFKKFGEKADQIRNGLQLGSSIEVEVSKVANDFYQKLKKMKHPQNKEEESIYANLLKEYQEIDRIYNAVLHFFELIDMRLAQIREKIIFASSKLRELQENFRYQSLYKVNVKKLLHLALKMSSYTKDGPILPDVFPRKNIVSEGFKFFAVKKIDFKEVGVNVVHDPSVDDIYEKVEKLKIEAEIDRQQLVVKWLKYLKNELKKNKSLDANYYFYRIIEIENSVEVSLEVIYEIIQHACSVKEYKIIITPELAEEYIINKILVWKTNIHHVNKTSRF